MATISLTRLTGLSASHPPRASPGRVWRKSRRSKRPAKRRASQTAPYHQGRLDGLCGVYAVINAVAALCPELTDDQAIDLFKVLIKTLGRSQDRPLATIYRGLDRQGVKRLAKRACRFAGEEVATHLTLSTIPKPLTNVTTLGGLWSTLRQRLRPGSVAILGLDGREAHWSVAVRALPQSLRVSDSDGLATITRRQCSLRPSPTRIWLDPREILFLTRVERDPDRRQPRHHSASKPRPKN